MTAIYTPPPANNVQINLSNAVYTPPASNQVIINLIPSAGSVPVVQNAAFLV